VQAEKGGERYSSNPFTAMGLEGGQHHAIAALPQGKTRIIVQEARLASGPIWMGTESLTLHRDSISRPSSP
jgi:hypothetical protein